MSQELKITTEVFPLAFSEYPAKVARKLNPNILGDTGSVSVTPRLYRCLETDLEDSKVVQRCCDKDDLVDIELLVIGYAS